MAPHVLVIPYPAQGHINPLTTLSHHLASQGILITFLNTESTHSRIMKGRRNNDRISFNLPCNISLAEVSDGLPREYNRAANPEEAYRSLMNNMRVGVEDLICNINTQDCESPISCIISSSFLGWVSKVSSKFGIPWVPFWSQALSIYVIHRHLSDIISHGHFPPKKQDPKDVIDYIPGLPPLDPQDLPANIQIGDSSTILHQLFAQQIPLLEDADWVIGNTVEELELETEVRVRETIPIRSIGPLLTSNYLKDDKDISISPTSLSLWAESNCLPWLNSKPDSSVLYVSFGSMFSMSKDQIEEIAMGLLQSEQLFLWVLRPDIVKETDCETTPNDILSQDFLENTKDRGLVVPWSSQREVLSHPSVGGFFTHCGWNSTIESVSMGVPLLVFPQGVDQYTNRMLVTKQWKVGLNLETCEGSGMVERAEIARAAKALFEGEEGKKIKKKINELKETVRKAVNGGSSSKHLKALVDRLLSTPKRNGCLKSDQLSTPVAEVN